MGGIFKGKKGVSTTTQTTSAPAYLQPQLEFSAQEARRLYDQGVGGPFISPEEEAATRALYNQAQGGLSSTSLAAQNQLQKTLQGDYLGITPELQNYMDVIARRSEQSYNENVLPSLRSGYGRSGAFGGSDFQQGLQTSGRNFTRELADNLSGVALRNYQGERANQQNALGLAPTYEQLSYSPLLMQQAAGSDLSNIGTTKANRPLALLEAFNRNLQTSYIPGTNVTTTATPYKKGSTFGKLMGGALTIGGALIGGPAGAQGGQQLGSVFGGNDSTSQQAYSPGGLVNYNYTQPQASSGSLWGSLFGGGGQKAPASMGSWYGSRGFLG
jgi:hypothetical protein